MQGGPSSPLENVAGITLFPFPPTASKEVIRMDANPVVFIITCLAPTTSTILLAAVSKYTAVTSIKLYQLTEIYQVWIEGIKRASLRDECIPSPVAS